MLSLYLILAGAAAFALSGLPACFLPSSSRAGRIAAACLMAAGGALGLSGLGLSLSGGGAFSTLSMGWTLPWGRLSIALDPLSSIFLALVFLIPPLGSVYGLEYSRGKASERGGRGLGASYGLLSGAMVLVLVARDGVFFLIAWELMALSAYFASTSEGSSEARKAGWTYLIATHIGTLCLFAMFALWSRSTGSFALSPAAAMPSEAGGAIFVLALLGFGFKAGLVPLHYWLPGAHANAPSHVSAVMSGVMLKMGVYGILRMASLLGPPPAWWGGTLLAAGAATGLVGIVLAIGQSDIKRVLAYSSVENVGIIAMGSGLALLGRAEGRADLVLLGLGGALFHVLNHGLFKPLLFFGAGSVMRATGTRDLGKLGGLAKRMPVAAALFLAGSVAICGLPPMNGFVGEWLIYLGLFGQAASPIAMAAAAAAALAMIGALALACFVRLYFSAFLGSPRGERPLKARDAGAAMTAPAVVLAAACALVGLFPATLFPALESAARAWAGEAEGSAGLALLAPAAWIGRLGLALAAACALVFLLIFLASRRRARTALTWDCGYAAPDSRMQYGASSFGRTVLGLASPPRPKKGREGPVKGYFPAAARYEKPAPDAAFRKIALIPAAATGRLLPLLHALQRGQTHLYLLYVLVITIVLLAAAGLGVMQ
jgi:hydrogenase-4 component B